MNFVLSIILDMLGAAFIGLYVFSIVKFVKNKKKPKEERATWPTVLFIILTVLIGLTIALVVGFFLLAMTIVANM